jgi:phosphate transport system substrate-binding protein
VRASVAAAAFAVGAVRLASSMASDERRPKTVEWLIPAVPPNRPQTDEERATGQRTGRTLPTPEILQPALDPALPPYHPRKGLKLSGHFKGAASDVLPRLVKLWTDRFRTYYPAVEFDVPPPYAGSLGAKELVKETLDFVFVSRELKPDDVVDFKARFGYDPLSIPISGGSYRHYGFLDAVGFFVSQDNPLEGITFDQLDAILSATRHRGGAPITRWGQLGLGGEWADKPIHVYGVKPWNGFEEFVRQRVLSREGKRGEWRDDLHLDPVVFPIARRVAEDRYGLGYAGLAYLDAPVRVLALAEREGDSFQAATYEAVASASYPLSRLVYFNVNRPPGRPLAPALDEFLRFVLSREGQQIVLDQAIYVPLRAAQAGRSLEMLGGRAR